MLPPSSKAHRKLWCLCCSDEANAPTPHTHLFALHCSKHLSHTNGWVFSIDSIEK